MRDTNINVIERLLEELFLKDSMFACFAKKDSPHPGELTRFNLYSARVWRLSPIVTAVFIGKDTSHKNEVVIWMPSHKFKHLKEIAGVLAGLRCCVTINTGYFRLSIMAERVRKCFPAELHELLGAVYKPLELVF